MERCLHTCDSEGSWSKLCSRVSVCHFPFPVRQVLNHSHDIFRRNLERLKNNEEDPPGPASALTSTNLSPTPAIDCRRHTSPSLGISAAASRRSSIGNKNLSQLHGNTSISRDKSLLDPRRRLSAYIRRIGTRRGAASDCNDETAVQIADADDGDDDDGGGAVVLPGGKIDDATGKIGVSTGVERRGSAVSVAARRVREWKRKQKESEELQNQASLQDLEEYSGMLSCDLYSARGDGPCRSGARESR